LAKEKISQKIRGNRRRVTTPEISNGAGNSFKMDPSC
jgi:hypothetical protein